jgi:hypothetical protein
VPLFKIYFKWKEKDVELMARELDMTHPYFVSIKDIVIPNSGSLIIDPSQDEIRKKFGDSRQIMIPFQTVSLIEELEEEEPKKKEGKKVMPFSVVDEKDEH